MVSPLQRSRWDRPLPGGCRAPVNTNGGPWRCAGIDGHYGPCEASSTLFTPRLPEPAPIEAGDWVQVWGQVKEVRTEDVGMLIRFESRSEQYEAWVRTDRILKPEGLPSFTEPCTALYKKVKGSLLQCTKHHDHPGLHVNGSQEWNHLGVYGYIEVT